MSLYSALGVGQEDEGQQAYVTKVEIHTAYKEERFPHEGSQAGEQLVQRCCAISILGGLQGTSGSSPEQPGRTPELTLLGQEVRAETSLNLPNYSVIPWM